MKPPPSGGRRGLALVAAFVAAGFGTATAKSLYEYRDGSGAKVFSDRPPADGRRAKKSPMLVRPQPKLRLERRGPDHQPIFFVANQLHGPVEVGVDVESSVPVGTIPRLPLRVVVPALGEAELFRVASSPRAAQIKVLLEGIAGDPTAVHAPPRPYRPPFAKGQQFLVTQGFFGNASHFRPGALHAVDIAMPEGAAVTAARGGRVMEIEADYFEGGADEALADRANSLRILHDDGTMAIYAHLAPESVVVRLGDEVVEGQTLAASGNTGFSTGPHLHFAIERNAGLRVVTEPFEFRRPDGRAVRPERGTVLAVASGG